MILWENNFIFSKLVYAKSRSHDPQIAHVPYVPKKSYTLFQNLFLTLSKYLIFSLWLRARQYLDLVKNDKLMYDLNEVFK